MTDTLPAPTCVARDDAHPCPRVEVTITVLPDTAAVSVFRIGPGGTVPVRGVVQREVTDPMTVTDYETPFGVPVTYTATAYDDAGIPALASAPSAPITLPDPTCPWLADPMLPLSARQVTPYEWTAREHTREHAVLWPATGTAAIVLSATRPRATTPIGVLTYTDTEATDLAVLLSAPGLVFRPPSAWGWAGGHVYPDDVKETRWAPKAPTDARRLWTFTLIPVRVPDAILFEPVGTWRQVAAFYPSWAALRTAKASWADLMRNPDPGAP